jgi:hypothetical protein
MTKRGNESQRVKERGRVVDLEGKGIALGHVLQGVTSEGMLNRLQPCDGFRHIWGREAILHVAKDSYRE